MTDPVVKLMEALCSLPEEFFGVLCEVNSDSLWFIMDNEVHWNTDKNFMDLSYGDGNTYSGYIKEGPFITESWTQVNIDNQTGFTQTIFFNNDNKAEVPND